MSLRRFISSICVHLIQEFVLCLYKPPLSSILATASATNNDTSNYSIELYIYKALSIRAISNQNYFLHCLSGTYLVLIYNDYGAVIYKQKCGRPINSWQTNYISESSKHQPYPGVDSQLSLTTTGVHKTRVEKHSARAMTRITDELSAVLKDRDDIADDGEEVQQPTTALMQATASLLV